ncbi:MAG: hypothetical protein HY684_01410 [Chloroflexi bacterium]|nr:hypothetical protein [Chloroflexota bacterium]
MKPILFLDPRPGITRKRATLSPRLHTLEGTTIGFMTNVWRNFDLFVDYASELLRVRFPDVKIVRAKSISQVRKGEKLRELEQFCAEVDVAVSGLGA